MYNMNKEIETPADSAKKTVKSELTMSAGTYIAKVKRNLFPKGMNTPVLDDYGHPIADPNKVGIIIANGKGELTEYGANKDNVPSDLRTGLQVTLVWKVVEDLNHSEPFLYSIGAGTIGQ